MKGGIRSPLRGLIKGGDEVSTAPELTYIPGAFLDGTHDHLQTNTAFSVTSSLLLARLSFRVAGGDGTTRMIVSALNNTILIGLNIDNKIQVNVSNDPDTGPYLTAESASTYTTGAAWHNLLIALNTNAAAGSKTIQIYVNDQDDLGVVVDDDPAFLIGDPIKLNVGSYDFDAGLWNGGLAGLWLGLDQYLDLSITDNRRQFVDAEGNPYVNLGVNGQGPTGTSPTLYLNNPYTSFATNKGTSGDLRLFGALTADTSPND